MVRDSERERCLEVGFSGVPVDYVAELDALACIARRKPDGLNKPGARGFARNLQRDAGGAALDFSNLSRTRNELPGRRLLLIPIHVPRRPLPGVVVGNGQSRRRGE